MDNFYSFYKKTNSKANLPYEMRRPGKETERSRQHHQSQTRLMKTDHRKSGKNNLVAASHGHQMKSSFLEDFIKSKGKTKRISEVQAKEILRSNRPDGKIMGQINLDNYEDFDPNERFGRSINRTKVRVEYFPSYGWFLVNHGL